MREEIEEGVNHLNYLNDSENNMAAPRSYLVYLIRGSRHTVSNRDKSQRMPFWDHSLKLA